MITRTTQDVTTVLVSQTGQAATIRATQDVATVLVSQTGQVATIRASQEIVTVLVSLLTASTVPPYNIPVKPGPGRGPNKGDSFPPKHILGDQQDVVTEKVQIGPQRRKR